MDNLERRLIALEHQQHHDRELTDWRLDEHSRRLQALERNPLQRLSYGSTIKLLIALLLPLAVLFATGDLRKAAMAIRLAAGG
jgi:hypothetical protein